VFLVLALAVPAAVAQEEKDHKWRFGVQGGFINPQDEIKSDSANVLLLFTRDTFELQDAFIDPRDDSSVFGTLELQPGSLISAQGQYEVTKTFIVEASLGYSKTDLGEVEVQAQFDGVEIDEDVNFNFATFRVNAGEVELVPLQLSALWRFRPRASFKPYLGLGMGYTFVGYSPSDEFDQLSYNLDNSQGGQATLTTALIGNPSLVGPGANSPSVKDLSGARVDVSDTFTYHLAGGFEYLLKRKWSLVLDVRYTFSSRKIEVGFNGDESLGVSVPQLNDFVDSPAANQQYGAVQVTSGGLIDGGSLVPLVGQPANTDCQANPTACFFDPTAPDGEVDTGFYYVKGGDLKLQSLMVQFGFRYTF
jgi:outer membrane protein W